MRRIATLGLVAVLGALCALGVVPGTTAPAAALLGYPCPPGAPSGSSLCSPAGWLSLTGALPAGYAAGGAGVATTTAAVGGTSAASAALTAGTSVMVGLGTWGAFQLLIDPAETDLELAPATSGPSEIFGGFISASKIAWSESITASSTAVAINSSINVKYGYVTGGYVSVNTRVGYEVTCRSVSSGTFSYHYAVIEGVRNVVWDNNQSTTGTINQTVTCAAGSVVDEIKWYARYLRNTAPTDVDEFWQTYAEPHAGGLIGTLEAEFVCRSGSGDTSHYVDTPVDGLGLESVEVDMPEFNCPTGETLVYGIIEWVTDAGRQTVYEYEAPEWVQDIPIEWPNCADGSCTLSLWQVLSPSKIVSCGKYAVGCPEWWQDPYKADNYECHYGPYVVQLGMCSVFRKPGGVSPNVTSTTEPDGSIKTGTPNFSEDPDDYPSEGIDPDPPVPPWPIPDDIPDPVDDGSMACWPTGWAAFNPLNWVYQPVRCALVWAWVPDSVAVAEDLTRGQGAVAEHGVLGVVPAALDVPGQVADGFDGGCTGALTTFELDTAHGSLEAGIPCSPAALGEVSTKYSTFRTLLGAVLVASTGWGVFITVRGYFGGRDQ